MSGLLSTFKVFSFALAAVALLARLGRLIKRVPKNEFDRTFELGLVIVVALLIMKALVLNVYYVAGRSMLPTLQQREIVAVWPTAFWFGAPESGDLIVFEQGGRTLVKRIAGRAGDAVVKGPHGYRIGIADEPEARPLGEDEVFVTGDNSEHSMDSRSFGPIPIQVLKGKVLVVIWPLNRMRVPGPVPSPTPTHETL